MMSANQDNGNRQGIGTSEILLTTEDTEATEIPAFTFSVHSMNPAVK